MRDSKYFKSRISGFIYSSLLKLPPEAPAFTAQPEELRKRHS